MQEQIWSICIVHLKWQLSTLPAFINEIHHQRTEDEQNEHSDEHVVDGPDVINLEQLTAEQKHKREQMIRLRFW